MWTAKGISMITVYRAAIQYAGRTALKLSNVIKSPRSGALNKRASLNDAYITINYGSLYATIPAPPWAGLLHFD